MIQLPTELEKMFVTVEHDLPNHDQLVEIARGIATEDGELPDGRQLDDVLDAASGLTRLEAENAFSLSLVRHGRLQPGAVWELKTQALRKSGLLQLHRGGDNFDTLGGMSQLKAFTRRALIHRGRHSGRVRPRGVSWLNDHESDVFVVCMANDVQKLPPEFSRAERFDAVFFLDLPDRKQKDEIWQLYLQQFDLTADDPRPEDHLWTGAEIRSCCRLAALLDTPLAQAAENVVPVAVTSAESVDRLRHWADGRCLSSEKLGVYRIENATPKRRRSIAKPSNN